MPSPSNFWCCPNCLTNIFGSQLDAAPCPVCKVGYLFPVSPFVGTFTPLPNPRACDNCGAIYNEQYPHAERCVLCGEGTVYTIKPEYLPWDSAAPSDSASQSATES